MLKNASKFYKKVYIYRPEKTKNKKVAYAIIAIIMGHKELKKNLMMNSQ